MAAPAAKRARTEPARAEDLAKGTLVLYGSDKCGRIRDAYVPIDEFWVEDLETEELVRDDEGSAVGFKAEQLRLMINQRATREQALESDMPVAKAGRAEKGSSARVLVMATEVQMVQMLEHFSPTYEERTEPQLMLAVPAAKCKCGPNCLRYDPLIGNMCGADCPLSSIVGEGVPDEAHELASRLRPDMELQVRPYHLKQAIEQIGPDLTSLDAYYCLAAMTLPFGTEDINEAADDEQKIYRENIRCQIDVDVSASGVSGPGNEGMLGMARRGLRESCRIDIAAALWAVDRQTKLRQNLGVDLPLTVWDGSTKIFLLIMPEDALTFTRDDGMLCYEAAGVSIGSALPRSEPVFSSKPLADSNPASKQEGDKNVGYWKNTQDEFKYLGKLPTPWIFIRSSRDKDVVYYMNTETHATSMERPLPAGWTKHTSKSTGKTYYFHAQRRKSVFDPIEMV